MLEASIEHHHLQSGSHPVGINANLLPSEAFDDFANRFGEIDCPRTDVEGREHARARRGGQWPVRLRLNGRLGVEAEPGPQGPCLGIIDLASSQESMLLDAEKMDRVIAHGCDGFLGRTPRGAIEGAEGPSPGLASGARRLALVVARAREHLCRAQGSVPCAGRLCAVCVAFQAPRVISCLV